MPRQKLEVYFFLKRAYNKKSDPVYGLVRDSHADLLVYL